MITRIELDGFKTFNDFSLDLVPFQVIIGANGSGKSNLFDAILLLSRLTDTELHSAFQNSRGELFEQFTIQPDNQPGKFMRFAVEMLVDRTVKDNWGAEVRLPNPRLRYELQIKFGYLSPSVKQLYITDESLMSIAPDKDHWLKGFMPSLAQNRHSGAPQVFMSAKDGEPPNNTLTLHPDEAAGESQTTRRISLAFSRQTSLSRVDSCDFPHILAARQEMQKWRLLEGRPDVLRLPSPLGGSGFVSIERIQQLVNFNEIPWILAQMKAEDAMLLKYVSHDLSNLAPHLVQIDVEKNEAFNQYEIYAQTQDGRRLSQALLSDGILRLLTLAIVRNYPTALYGVFLFEEPENSIHPAQLKRLVRLMREMTTDLSDLEQNEKPLRQLLVTTHSPELVSELEMEKGELVFAELVTRIEHGLPPTRVTRMTPVIPDEDKRTPERAYSLARALEYLNDKDIREARTRLREAYMR